MTKLGRMLVEDGIQEERFNNVRNLLKAGVSKEIILQTIDITIEEINTLEKEIRTNNSTTVQPF